MEENKKLDLWGNLLDFSNNASESLEIFNSQAELLTELTEGKVKAKFVKIEYNYNSYLKDSAIKVLNIVKKTIPQEKNNDNLKDANCFYEQADYKFEIYNEQYKYRVFTLNYKSIFPFIMHLEPDILERNTIEINNIQDVTNILQQILTSSKVKFIIQQMIKNT